MDQVNGLITYFTTHPQAAIAAALALGGLIYLLTRKPKAVRDAEARLRLLRNEKADQYNKPRPLR